MYDPKLILARAITLLFRENQLSLQSDTSVELVRNVLRDVYVVEHSIGMDHEKQLIMSLKTLVLQLCDSFKDPFDKSDLIQQVRIITETEDPKLFEAIKVALETEYTDSSLKKSVVATRKQLDNYFREKTITEMFKKASVDIVYNREKIVDISNYVQEFVINIEPLITSRKMNDPAVMGSMNFGDLETIRTVFQEAHKEATENSRVYVTGFNGFNNMTQGGLRPQCSMGLALQHKYKTGLQLSLYSQVMQRNRPKTVDKNKIPCQVFFSFEDELTDIATFLFVQAKYSETREYVDPKNYTHEEMASYVGEKYASMGWTPIIERIDPTAWTYKDAFNYIIGLEAQGYSVEGLWLGYMMLLPTTGCIQGAQGESLRDMLRRFRNFCMARGAIFYTPHQLSTDAKVLLRGICTDSQFAKEVAEKGYSAGSKQLDQELDLEFYHHIFKHGKDSYLAMQRGKHRGAKHIQDEEKSFILKFPNNMMPIPDDLPEDPVIKRVGASTRINGENADLVNIF